MHQAKFKTSLFTAVAVVLGIAGLHDARASLIYTNCPDLTILPNTGNFITFRADTGVAGINLNDGNATGQLYFYYFFPVVLTNSNVGNPIDNTVDKLAPGTTIDSSLTFGGNYAYTPAWLTGGPGIVGFKTVSGNYGWAGLDIKPIDELGNVSMTLLDFAFETVPGVAITTVPEPTSLVLLAAGAGMVLRRRQRNRIGRRNHASI